MKLQTFTIAQRFMTASLALGGLLACTTSSGDNQGHSAARTSTATAVPVTPEAPTGVAPPPPTTHEPAMPPSVTMGPGVGMGGPTTRVLPTSARVGSTLPADTNVKAGDTLSVQLSGQAFDQGTEGGGLDLSFDPAVVQVVGVAVDTTVWEFFTQSGAIDNVAGRVQGILFASVQGRRGTFPIATVSLRALTSGRPNLVLTEANASPFASGGQRLAVQLQ